VPDDCVAIVLTKKYSPSIIRVMHLPPDQFNSRLAVVLIYTGLSFSLVLISNGLTILTVK